MAPFPQPHAAHCLYESFCHYILSGWSEIRLNVLSTILGYFRHNRLEYKAYTSIYAVGVIMCTEQLHGDLSYLSFLPAEALCLLQSAWSNTVQVNGKKSLWCLLRRKAGRKSQIRKADKRRSRPNTPIETFKVDNGLLVKYYHRVECVTIAILKMTCLQYIVCCRCYNTKLMHNYTIILSSW